MKKLLAVLLVLAMVLAFVTPLFAEGVTLEDLDARVKVLEGGIGTSSAELGLGFAYETSNKAYVFDPYVSFSVGSYALSGDTSLTKGMLYVDNNSGAPFAKIIFNDNIYLKLTDATLKFYYDSDMVTVYGGTDSIGTFAPTAYFGSAFSSAYNANSYPLIGQAGLVATTYDAGDFNIYAGFSLTPMDMLSVTDDFSYELNGKTWENSASVKFTPMDMLELDVSFDYNSANEMGLAIDLFLNNLGPASFYIGSTLAQVTTDTAAAYNIGDKFPLNFGAIVSLDTLSIFASLASDDLKASTVTLDYDAGIKVPEILFGMDLYAAVNGSTATGSNITIFSGLYTSF